MAFNPVHAGGEAAVGVIGGRQKQAGAQQFEVQTGARRAGHLGEGSVSDVTPAGQLSGTQARCLGRHALDLVFGNAVQNIARVFGDSAHQDEVAEAL